MKYLTLLLLILIGAGCNKHTIITDDDGGDDPPPPPVYDHYEEEPNDELEDAQFITVLPNFAGPEVIQGEHWVPYDPDCYQFWLDPSMSHPSIHVSINLLTDPILSPKLKLWQTTYDAVGNPDGYILRGTWVGQDGYLFIDAFEVAYGGLLVDNDLIIELIPWGGIGDPPLLDDEYLLEFWSE